MLTFDLLPDLVAGPHFPGTVQLELDEVIIPQLGLSEHVGPCTRDPAYHPAHSVLHAVHPVADGVSYTPKDALGGGRLWPRPWPPARAGPWPEPWPPLVELARPALARSLRAHGSLLWSLLHRPGRLLRKNRGLGQQLLKGLLA